MLLSKKVKIQRALTLDSTVLHMKQTQGLKHFSGENEGKLQKTESL